VTILIITDYYPPDRVGGVGIIAHGLAESYRALGHRVIVLTTGRSTEESDVIRGGGSLVMGVLGNNLRAWRLIRREGVSLVHLHQAGTTLFLLGRPFMRRFPFVLDSLQVSYLGEAQEVRTVRVAGRRIAPQPREWVERFILAPVHVVLDFIGFALSDAVTAVSDDNRRELERTYGQLARRPVTTIPNGISAADPTPVHFRDTALEERLRGHTVVGYVGVLRCRKRVANLLLAFAAIAAECPDATLLIVGGGRGYDAPLRAVAAEQGIADRVVFTGAVSPDRARYYMSLLDVFCLLSSYEGMPMALLEAMQLGKAVIATDRYGMHDLLNGSNAGVLVPVDDIPAAAAAIRSLVTDDTRRRALGAAAREHVRSRFTWDRIARRYLEVVGR
jgi:glycosyltransferase involved in cell wall biosynthesis